MYPEVVETKQGKDVGAFYGVPGRDLLVTIGGGPLRGGRVVGAKAYIVSGNALYSVTTGYAATSLGTLSTSSGPVSMINNLTQLLVSDGVSGYLVTLATGAFSTVASFPNGGNLLAYQDGFGITNVAGTDQWNQSNLNDLSMWNALNFSNADAKPDNIISMIDINREVWLFGGGASGGAGSTEVWVNAGLPGFAFQRLSGVFIENGSVAPHSSAIVGDSPMWLGQGERGAGVAYRASGYTAHRVSTHAIEREWQGYSTMTDAIAFAYQQEGHEYYVLTFPTGDATWVYDVTESERFGAPMWHERASFANGAFHRDQSNFHVYFNGKNTTGDYQNGNLYGYNLGTFTDAGATRKWLRSWRAFPAGREKFVPMRFEALQIDAQTGIKVPDGTNPQLSLRWSNDGGWTWSSERFSAFGKVGETGKRAVFRRLGQTSRSRGLDRVFELTGTDAVPLGLIGADLDAEPT